MARVALVVQIESLPFLASPLATLPCEVAPGVCAWAAVERLSTAATRRTNNCMGTSPRLRDDIDQRRLAPPDPFKPTLDRRRKVLGIADRPFAVHAVPLRHFCIVDVGFPEGGADVDPVHAPIALARHSLDQHDLLMIGAVVVHDGQQGDAVMDRRPQHTRGVVQVAVGLNVDRQPAVLPVGERGAHRRRRAIAEGARPLPADILIVLVEVPQSAGPAADESLPGDE